MFATPPLARDEVVTALARAGWTAQQNGGALEVKRRKMWSFEFKGAARELRSEVGSKTRSTLRAKSTRPAFLLFGPFCSLPKGQWTATLTLRSLQPTGHCVMEVSGGGQVFASRSLDLRTPMDGPVGLPFVLERHEPLLEVRLCSGDDPVEVEIVQLEICAAF